jgi:hypothetical protein
MTTFALALRAKGVPVPEIAAKLTIKSGKDAGAYPSVASVYRALAEADDVAAMLLPGPRATDLADDGERFGA